MREINVMEITKAVKRLCVEANPVLPRIWSNLFCASAARESNPTGKAILQDLCANMDAARELQIPVCQDTGMAVVFLEIGQQVTLVGGNLEEAVHEGVRRGYVEGLLRCSIVADPLRRVNTNDNTPAVIHTRIVDGEQVSITVSPKGFGSENMRPDQYVYPIS